MSRSQAELEKARRALLAKRLQKAKQKKAPTLGRRPAAEALVLSFSQQRLWFLSQLEPDSAAYNTFDLLRLKGRLDVDALGQALDEIVRRHQVLHMIYLAADEDDVRMEPHPRPTLDLEMVDLRSIPPAEREAEARRQVAQVATLPFDLARELPIRANLWRLDEEETLLLLIVHHIAIDGWSMSVLVKELRALYQAFSEGSPSPLPELAIQYADFAYWQRNWLQGEVLDRQVAYWRQKLAGAPATLELLTDRPRPAVLSTKGAIYSFRLSSSLSGAIKALSQDEGVTLFMTLLSAFQALLYRYTGQEDFVIGVPIAGRTRSETEELIGFFVNTLVLRADLAGDPTGRELLQQTRQMTLEAYEHQEIPFEKLVEELQPERSLSHNPLFQVMFMFQNMPRLDLELPDLSLEQLTVDIGTTKFDLTLAVEESGDEIVGTIIYSTDLFDPDTIRRLVHHYEVLLQGLVARPDCHMSELPLLTPAERDRIVDDWRDNQVTYPPVVAMHQLFEQQVARSLEAVAVIAEEGQYTYRELNARANQVAHYLQELGVGPEVRVGLFVERKLDSLVGLLGILKAGGAYVPLDPLYPLERLRVMIEDVQIKAIVTQAHLAPGLPDQEGRPVVRLDSDWAKIAECSPENPNVPISPANLFYVLFTSGSTGRPKGVAVEHRNYLNYFHGVMPRLEIKPGMDFAMVSTFSTDLGTIQFWAALTTGGTTHIIAYERATDPKAMVDYFRRYPIDSLKLVPSHFEALQGVPGAEDIVPRHLVIFTGEPNHWDTVARVRAVNPGCMIQDHYGVTETTCATTTYIVPEKLSQDYGPTLPVGQALGNVQIYIVNGHMEPCPVGVPGELCIGGLGVTRGYFNRPRLSAECFIPDPFSRRPGARLYRTGDLACYRADGTLRLLGRGDHQIKIRGYRIEAGEIESLLLEQSGVQDAVVVAREDASGDKRLVAYVVPRPSQDGDFSTGRLRDRLQENLPDYMVPSAFVTLEAIPLNPNGKVDRFALPEPEYTRLDGADRFVAPRNELEAHMAACWSAVLGIEEVGIDDNFFDLGGDSFKAIRAVRQIGESVSVIDLFKYSTIRQLAAHLSRDDAAPGGLLHLLSKPVPAGQQRLNLVCIPYGGGSAVVFQPLAEALPVGHMLYAVQLPGHDYAHREEGLDSVAEVARRCVEQIKRDITGPIALYGHCVGGALAVEIARRLEQEGLPVVGVFQGGHFPSPRLPGKFFDFLAKTLRVGRWGSTRALYDELRALGGFTDLTEPEERAFVLEALRHDAQAGEDYYSQAYAEPECPKLAAPIVSIVGERDRATEFYQERYLEWQYFGQTVDLAVIPQAGHYFLKHQVSELAGTIVERATAWQQATVGERAQTASPQSVAWQRPSLNVFFLVALGQFISLIGTSITSFALGVWVYQETGSVLDLGIVWFFVGLPTVIFSPIAGALADRWDRRTIMIWSDLAAAARTLILLILLLTNSLEIWHIYIVTAIGSIANTFQQPAYTAAVTQLVPKRYLGHANGIVQLAGAAGLMLAPLLGGTLVVLIGLPGIALLDVVTCIVAVGTLVVVRFPDALFQRREEPFLKEIVGGWTYVLKRQGLLIMVNLFAFTNLMQSIVIVLLTPLVLMLATPIVLGNVTAVNGIGMIVGSLVMSIWGGTRRRVTGVLGFMALLGLSVVVMGLRPSPIYVAAGLFSAGAAIALANSHWLALIQTKVGLELQGRVIATDTMVSTSMQPLGFLLAGSLYEGVFAPLMAEGSPAANSLSWLVGTGPARGMGLLLVVVGVLSVGLAVGGYSYRRLRFMEDELPDAIPDAFIAADKDELQALADRQL